MERFSCLGREGREFVDQLATSVAENGMGGAMPRKGICLSGCDFTPSARVLARITGPASDERNMTEQERMGGADTDGVWVGTWMPTKE